MVEMMEQYLAHGMVMTMEAGLARLYDSKLDMLTEQGWRRALV